MRLEEWRSVLPPDAVFVGSTAAQIHGLQLGREVVEVAVPPHRGTRSRRGLLVRHMVLPRHDVVAVRDLNITSLCRTLRDIAVLEPEVEALIAVDMAIHLRRATKKYLREYTNGVVGLPGARRMRRLVELAEPAESPMETRLRWRLLESKLPRPEVQSSLVDRNGRFVGRADLYYPQARTVIEFDGRNHRERLVTDNRRQNLLVNAGYRVLRFTAADVYQRPDGIVAEVKAALGSPNQPRINRPSDRDEHDQD